MRNTSKMIIELASEIVTSYVKKNDIEPGELSEVINGVSLKLRELGTSVEVTEHSRIQPAVDPKRSLRPSHICCLEDGLKFKSLKRHLKAAHGLTPDQYRQKWMLPATYPMVAPDYAAVRSKYAKKIGLGHR